MHRVDQVPDRFKRGIGSVDGGSGCARGGQRTLDHFDRIVGRQPVQLDAIAPKRRRQGFAAGEQQPRFAHGVELLRQAQNICQLALRILGQGLR